jgi:xanthine dehydrogenase accessory factor
VLWASEDQAALRFAAASAAALCTIVGIDGSFSRRVGAQLAVSTDGTTAGSLSDGCLEAELASQAQAAQVAGIPKLLRYGRGSPFLDFRLPCGSGLDILVDPKPDRCDLQHAVGELDRRRPAEIVLPVGSAHLLQRRCFLPALRLIVLGAGPEAESLADLAAAFGAQCQPLGPRTGLSLGQPPRGLVADPWTAVVLLFHDHDWEEALLRWALGTPAFYVGLIGGAAARASRQRWLASEGYGGDQCARIRSPIGLIPRTREAGTLALSILAEVVQDYQALVDEVDAAMVPECVSHA